MLKTTKYIFMNKLSNILHGPVHDLWIVRQSRFQVTLVDRRMTFKGKGSIDCYI